MAAREALDETSIAAGAGRRGIPGPARRRARAQAGCGGVQYRPAEQPPKHCRPPLAHRRLDHAARDAVPRPRGLERERAWLPWDGGGARDPAPPPRARACCRTSSCSPSAPTSRISRGADQRALHYPRARARARARHAVGARRLRGQRRAERPRRGERPTRGGCCLLDWVRYSAATAAGSSPTAATSPSAARGRSRGCSARRCRSQSRRSRRRRTPRAESPAITAARVQAARAGAGALSAVSVPAMSAESQIGVTGLAVMGANLARNIASRDVPVAVHNRSPARTKEFMEQYGSEGQVHAFGVGRGVRRLAREAAPDHRDGEGRWPRRRRDRGARAAARRRRHHHRRRQLQVPRHPPPHRRVPRARPALHRLGRVRRRGGRPARALDHARRRARGLRRDRGDLHHDRRAGRRHSLLRLHRPRRRGPLREDGAQRHRVRRHAADHRGVRPAASRRGHVRGGAVRRSSRSGTRATSTRT